MSWLFSLLIMDKRMYKKIYEKYNLLYLDVTFQKEYKNKVLHVKSR